MNRLMYGVVGSGESPPPIPPPSCVYLLDATYGELMLIPGLMGQPMTVTDGGSTVSYSTPDFSNFFGAASAGIGYQTSPIYLNLASNAPPVCFELDLTMPAVYGGSAGFANIFLHFYNKAATMSYGSIGATAQRGYNPGKFPIQPSVNVFNLGNGIYNTTSWTNPIRVGVRIVPQSSLIFTYVSGLTASYSFSPNDAEVAFIAKGQYENFTSSTVSMKLITSPADFLTVFPQPGVRTTVCGQVF